MVVTVDNATHEQVHDGANFDDMAPEQGEQQADTFFCTHGNHWVSRAEAYYPQSRNPAICKVCAAARRQQNRKTKEEERLQQATVVGEIPAAGNRGGTKRVTLSLSRYAITALEVLAVGRSVSQVAEEAVTQYLAHQASDVIAFVGRMFANTTEK